MGFDELATDHAQDSDGSPYISVTRNPEVAREYAGPDGQVYVITLPKGRAVFNPHNHNNPAGNTDLWDEEYLVPLQIPAWAVDNPNGDCTCY